jgi:hypothetical protein
MAAVPVGAASAAGAGGTNGANGAAAGGDGRPKELDPVLARRAAALVQPPAPMRNMHVNVLEESAVPSGPSGGARRPEGVDGRPLNRHERNRLEAEAKRQKKRDLRRQRQRGA